MPRNEFTSIFLPGAPIPEPPDWRPFFSIFFQSIIILVLISFIGFLIFETVMDALDQPIWVGGNDIIKQQITSRSDKDSAVQFSIISPLPESRIQGNNVTIICTWQPNPFVQLRSSPNSLTPPYVPELLIDGRNVDWTIKYNKSWIAQVELNSGLHNIRAAASAVEFIVEPSKSKENRITQNLYSNLNEKNKKPDLNANYQQDDYDYKVKKTLWPAMRNHVLVNDLNKCTVCHDIVTDKDITNVSVIRQTIKPVNGAASCVSCHGRSKIHSVHGNKIEIWENCSKCHVLHGTTKDRKGLLKFDFFP
ncbi:MAG: cytochrome c3 family protein [Planctomycetaceae bacterium]|jgi:hypothetical protein|nr:cytochrome c3 family protein [Planctomycetaceae bacterium]